jgi:ribose transport system permease protein
MTAIVRRRARAEWGQILARSRGAVLAGLILLALLIAYQVRSGHILNAFQLLVLANGGMALAWAAVGLTFVVIVGGFDLSVGAVMTLANVLAATLLTGSGWVDVPVLLAILVVGGLAGAINGWLVAVARVQSIIVTLAAMFVWSGVSLLILPQPGGSIPGYVSTAVAGSLTKGLPVALLWLAALLFAVWLFRQTPAWHAVFAVGDNESAAARSGVHATRVKIIAYLMAGACYAMAGLFLSGQSTGGDPHIGDPFLLTAFAAVVVGGTPLGGGRGTFVGAIFGAFIVATLGSVLLALGVTSYWTDVVQGSVLLAAVVLPILTSRAAGLLRAKRTASR